MRTRWPLILSIVALALLPSTAAATRYGIPIPVSSDQAPPGYLLRPSEARSVMERTPVVRRERDDGSLRVVVSVLRLRQPLWQVSYFRGEDELIRGTVDGRRPRVVGKVWTGPFVLWPVTRGDWTPFTKRLAIALVLLTLLFVAPFIDLRRPRRLIHLDVLAFSLFTLTFLLLYGGELYTTVPLQYVPLLYLYGRLLYVGQKGRSSRDGPTDSASWASNSLLLGGLLALLVLRVGWTLIWGVVGDIGYAGIFGADSLHHGWHLYTEHPKHFDTYGPVNYLIYLPFEALFPLGPNWSADNLLGAQLVSALSDAAVLVLVVTTARKLIPGRQGRRASLVAGYAWVACPMTFVPLAGGSNDAIVPMFVLASILAMASAPLRGALIGLGGAAKFAPLGLVPLLARGLRWSRREAILTSAAAAGVLLLSFLPYVRQSGLREVWKSTMGFQLGRDAPFSLWGLHPSLSWLHALFLALAIVTIVGAAILPRGDRTLRQVVALTGAVMLALQMAGTFWAHNYIDWFAAPAFIALLAPAAARTPRAPARPERADAIAI